MEHPHTDGTANAREALALDSIDTAMNTSAELSQMRSPNDCVLLAAPKTIKDCDSDFADFLVQRLTSATETQIQKTMLKHQEELLSNVSSLLCRHSDDHRGWNKLNFIPENLSEISPRVHAQSKTNSGDPPQLRVNSGESETKQVRITSLESAVGNSSRTRKVSSRDSEVKDIKRSLAKLKTAASNLGSNWVLENMPRHERMLHLAMGADTRFQNTRSLSEDMDVDFVEHLDGRRKTLDDLLHTPMFELIIGIAVCTNSVFIGWEVDYMTSQPVGGTPPLSLQCISYFYSFLFFIELILRLAGGWQTFFCAPEDESILCWNYLDFALVAASFVEVVLDIVATHDSAGGPISLSSVRIIRTLRVFRLVRLLRIVRFVRFVRALRTLVYSILCTLKSVFWSLVLMATIIYVFAIMFTQAATAHATSSNSQETLQTDETPLSIYWGTVAKSMLSLYMSITGGISWTLVLEPLISVSPGWACVFLLYISFVYFAVLNVVTGVFCQAAIESNSEDKDTMMVTVMRHKQMYTERFKEIFEEIDEDGSGRITLHKFLSRMDEPTVKDYFASLELYCADALCLFDIFEDAPEQGIRTDEFVLGCLRLKGTARSSDMIRLLNGNRQMMECLESIRDHLQCSGGITTTNTAKTAMPFRVFMDDAVEDLSKCIDKPDAVKNSRSNSNSNSKRL